MTNGVIYDTMIFPSMKYTKREKTEKGGRVCSGGLCLMSHDKKSLEAIQRNPRNVALRAFESLIKRYGYIEEGAKHPKAGVRCLIKEKIRSNPAM